MKSLGTNLIAAAILCCAFFAVVPASGDEPESGASAALSSNSSDSERTTSGYFIYTTAEDGTAAIVGTTSDAPDDLTIPATIDGKPVTEISGNEFSQTLRSVKISEGVTSIENGSFVSLHALSSAKIPASATSIGYGAFRDCESLTKIEVAKQNAHYRSVNGALVNKETGSSMRLPATKEGLVVVPEGVAKIDICTFDDPCALKRVVVPESVTSINSFAFSGEASFLKFEVSDKNPKYCSVDGALLTKDRKTLIRAYPNEDGIAVVPSSVTTLGDHAFHFCKSLKKAVISADVTSIDPYAFFGCDFAKFEVSEQNPKYCSENGVLLHKGNRSLVCPLAASRDVDVIVIPNGVATIDKETIVEPRWRLRRLVLPESVTSIDPFAFERCDNLTTFEVSEKNPKYCSVDGVLLSKDRKTLIRSHANEEEVVVPEDVAAIDDMASLGCESGVVVPEGVTTIGDMAFRGCESITSLKLPEGVTTIGNWAFSGCNSLASVSLPASLTSIGGMTFLNCAGLRSIEVSPDNPRYCAVDGALLSKDRSVLFRASVDDDGVAVVPDGVTTIADYAFGGPVKKIVLPASVTKINGGASFGCNFDGESLTSIEVSPDNPNYCVVDGALLSKDRRTLVRSVSNKKGVASIPDCVTKIDASAFAFDDSLKRANIPASVLEIDDAAFLACMSLTSITVDKNNPNYCVANGMLTSKDSRTIVRAFEQQGRVEIPETAMTIGAGAFFEQAFLTSVKIPNGVTKIEPWTFRGCISAVNFSIPSSVKSVGDYAFTGCAALKEITIPEGVVSIGECAFASCYSLTSVDVPASVSEIASSAFDMRSDKLTIRGVPGSYAEQYAEENGIPFVDASANADDDFDVDFDM